MGTFRSRCLSGVLGIWLLVGAAGCATSTPPLVRPSLSSGMAADLAYLTSVQLEGRELGSAGGDSAAVFLADRYRQLGVDGAWADNASGTAALLELGRRLAADPAPISVVLAHFDAEERGLWGSKAFVDDPVVLMLNLDMVGRLRGGPLIVEDVSGTDVFGGLLETAARTLGISLEFSSIVRGRSDHESFASRDVPSIALFTGFHEDYHRATDTADKLDLPGVLRIVELTEQVVRSVGVGR